MKSFYPFEKDEKWGFIDKEGNEIIPPQYEFCSFSTEGLAIVGKNGYYGFVDIKNDIVIPFCHKSVNQICEDTFFSLGKGLFDKHNKCLFPIEDEKVITPFFHNNFACITFFSQQQSGLLARSGNWIIKPQNELYFSFSVENGLIPVRHWRKSSSAGYINTNGEVVIPTVFSFAHPFSEGLASVSDAKNPFGFINLNGDYVIRPQFNDASNFSEGYAAVGITKGSTKYGFINKAGEIVISPKYSEVEPFKAGCAPVLIQRKCGLINTAGEFILEPKFKEIEYCSDGIFKVIDEIDNLRYFNSQGNWIYPRRN